MSLIIFLIYSLARLIFINEIFCNSIDIENE